MCGWRPERNQIRFILQEITKMLILGKFRHLSSRISIKGRFLKIFGQNFFSFMLTNVLPEPKLEPKLLKSVAFWLRTDFQYTKTEKHQNRKK